MLPNFAPQPPTNISDYQPTPIDEAARIATTVALCDGDLHRAAERLHMPAEEILLALTTDQPMQALLQRLMRAKLMINAYQNTQEISHLLNDDLATLKGDEKIKLLETYSGMFNDLLKSQNLIDPPNSNAASTANSFDRLLALLPPQARDAMIVMIQSTTTQTQLNPQNEPGVHSTPINTPTPTFAPDPSPLAHEGRLRRIRKENEAVGE